MVSIRDFSKFGKQQYQTYKIAYLPSMAVLSMCQDGFSSMRTLVKKGEQIEEGQIVASECDNSDNKYPACIHSPIPGVIKDIQEISMPNGKNSLSLLIEMSGNFTFSGRKKDYYDWKNAVSVSRKIKQISEMGIINTFEKNESLANQLDKIVTESKSQSAKPLVIRLFDKESDTSIESFIANQFKSQVLEGAAIIAEIINAPFVLFFSQKGEFSIPDESEYNDLFIKTKPEFIEKKIKNYPCGNYKQILKMTNQFLKTKHSIEYESVLGVSAETCLDVYNGIVHSYPAIDRFIQVQGDAVTQNQILKVRIGMTLRNIFNECGGFQEQPSQIIINSLVNGTAISDIDTPITRYVHTIFVTTSRYFPRQIQTKCIRCGKCNSICEEKLRPDKIYERYSAGDPLGSTYEKTIRFCTECQLCNTVCPSRIPLFQTIKFLKDRQNEENF